MKQSTDIGQEGLGEMPEPFFASNKTSQIAKDFIWNHLPELTKKFIVDISSMDENERKSLYIHKMEVFLKGDVKNGLVTNEIAILTLGNKNRNPNDEP